MNNPEGSRSYQKVPDILFPARQPPSSAKKLRETSGNEHPLAYIYTLPLNDSLQ